MRYCRVPPTPQAYGFDRDEGPNTHFHQTAALRVAFSRAASSIVRTNMRLSARNQLKGTVVEVKKGATTSHVRVDIGGGKIVTSSITNEAVDELGIKARDNVTVVIKASDVMIGVD
jgi:molybdopterin-binding protein